MKTGFRHDEHERDSDQNDTHRTHLDGQRHVVRTDQDGQSHAKHRSKQTYLRGTQKKFIGLIFTDLVRDPRLRSAGSEGMAQTPDHLRQQDRGKERQKAFNEKAKAH